MITISNPEKYRPGGYYRLSNEKIEVGNGQVIETSEDERESGSISTQRTAIHTFCKENGLITPKDYVDDGVSRSNI